MRIIIIRYYPLHTVFFYFHTMADEPNDFSKIHLATVGMQFFKVAQLYN